MQATFALLILLTTMAPISADDYLAHGRKELRTAQYAVAAKDLQSAADAFLTPQQTEAYIRTGHHEALADYETSLVYLTITYAKMGRVDDARATLRRISVAERLEPTYQALPLDVDAAEFESIAHQLLPEMPLPPNQALAEIHGGKRHRAEVA